LTGNGHLRAEDGDDLPVLQAATAGPAIQDIGTGVVLAMTLFTIGALVQRWTGLPVTMLFLVVALKLARAVPTAIEQGPIATTSSSPRS
jgi:Na+/citrate or Na+/malate symporter